MTHIFKNIFKSLLLITTLHTAATAQNLIPNRWHIKYSDNPPSHDSVSFNLSWQSQGLCYVSGKTIFETEFNVAKKTLKVLTNRTLTLTAVMQCQTDSIFINGHKVAENIPSSFVNKNAKSTFSIPSNILKAGNNTAEVYAQKFDRTGGVGNNILTLCADPSSAEIDIIIEAKDHLFEDTVPSFAIKYNSPAKQHLEILIINEFQERVYTHVQKLKKTGDGCINITLDHLNPGFYQCCAYLEGADNAESSQWIAINPQKIQCRNNRNEGYNEYWQHTIEQLDLVEPYYSMRKVDSLSRGAKDGFIVEFQSLDEVLIRAYLFLPRNRNENPVILHLPDRGQDFGDVAKWSFRNPDIAEMALCVRGHGISRTHFDPESNGGPGIWGYEIFDPDKNSYRGIFADCVRAIDFITQDYHFDNKRIAVIGSRQGGSLALATAALCKGRIAALAFFDPFLCDIEHYLKTKAVYTLEINDILRYYNNSHTFNDVINVQKMIDVLDMARDVKCATFFASSLFDDDCPPHTGFAAYNLISAPKEFALHPSRNKLTQSFYDEMMKFIINKIKE